MKRRTIAHLTRARRDRFGERVLHYHHDGHRWAPTTWYRSGEQSDELALGLHSLGVLVGTACSSEGSASSSTRPRPTDVPGIHDHSSEDSALAPETVLPEDIAALGDGPQPGEQFDVFIPAFSLDSPHQRMQIH